jgi:hypothetical protein
MTNIFTKRLSILSTLSVSLVRFYLQLVYPSFPF